MKRMLFQDEDMTSPLWTPREGGDPRAVSHENGTMVLSILPDGGHGEVGTQGGFEFTHGYAAARVKFHANPGAHAAFWLQTTEDYIPGQAEIDVAECFGRESVWNNVYWREPHQGYEEFSEAKRSTLIDPTVPRVYKVRWTPESYRFYIGRTLVHEITEGLSSRPKFPVLSIRVADYEEKQFVKHPVESYKMTVYWVRVWKM